MSPTFLLAMRLSLRWRARPVANPAWRFTALDGGTRCPHILCAVYGVKFLEDPKNIYGEARDLNVVRAGFRTDFPRATALRSRFTLTDKQLSQLLVWADTEAVERFFKENQDLVWYMIGGLAPNLSKPVSLN